MSENASAWADLTGRTLTKGQGTGNDFIFITDPKAEAVLDADLVARVCDRHFGLGADGFIRAAHTETFSTGQKILEKHPEATWFMDYRNADGTISEMCGNGVRAFVEYLRTEGLISLEVGEHVSIGTRAGVKTVARTDTGYAVDMGPWSFIHGDAAREGGEDSQVSARGLKTPRPALSISMGNPHTVVMLGSDGKLDGLDLGVAPVITPPRRTARMWSSWYLSNWSMNPATPGSQGNSLRWEPFVCACTNVVWGRPSPAAQARAQLPQPPASGEGRTHPTSGSYMFLEAPSR